jgi:hypothetical protein
MIVDVENKRVNLDFWKKIGEPINVVLDEAHSILNSRRSMTSVNIIITDWIALVRRVLGENSQTEGDLVFITQLPNRIDNICREMAHQVRYHVCHYKKNCNDCGTVWRENSAMPELIKMCPCCGSYDLLKNGHMIEIWEFSSMPEYNNWMAFGQETYYKHYFVRNIEQYFPLYNTLQWNNMFSEIYNEIKESEKNNKKKS